MWTIKFLFTFCLERNFYHRMKQRKIPLLYVYKGQILKCFLFFFFFPFFYEVENSLDKMWNKMSNRGATILSRTIVSSIDFSNSPRRISPIEANRENRGYLMGVQAHEYIRICIYIYYTFAHVRVIRCHFVSGFICSRVRNTLRGSR